MTAGGYDAVVVGAGIVGAACAADFVRNGMRVAVIEAGVIGGGATAAGMGHLTVMDDSEAQFALTRYSQVLWKELAQSLPRDVEYYPCGTIWVAADDQEMAEVRRKHEFYLDRGVATEILDIQALTAAEPNLRAGLSGGLLVPGDSVVYPPCAARCLLQDAERRGARLTLGRRVTQITDDGVRLDDGTSFSAGRTVIATGTDVLRWMPDVPVQPRKGHLVITDRYPGFLHHQLIELGYLKSAHALHSDSVAFNVQPRQTGQILIGSSRQYGAEDSAVEPHMLAAMMRRAMEYMPGIGRLSAIRSWTGFRAATPDKLPLIGLCPGYRNVYLATGHEGLGITTSLATARLLTDCLMGRESAIPRTPYLPEGGRLRLRPEPLLGPSQRQQPMSSHSKPDGASGAVLGDRPPKTIAVAVMTNGRTALRTSVSGEPRGPLCGMGVCYECRLTVDGVPHVRSCQTACREGMEVTTA